MTPNSTEDAQCAPHELPHDDLPRLNTIKDSAAYAKDGITEDLHPAFASSGVRYDTNRDCFAADSEDVYDEAVLFDSQKAFADALKQYQNGVKLKYKSQIDLCATHTWNEVMEYADRARNKYTGVGQKGIMKKIDNGLKTFQTAAPAIEAWLKLLPSTSIYGSIVCGGLTIILEVSIDGLRYIAMGADWKAGGSPTRKAPKGDPECSRPDAPVYRESGILHANIRLSAD